MQRPNKQAAWHYRKHPAPVDRIMQQRRYFERDAAYVVRQVAAGLATLHRAQIVHHDL
jgi:serine/threonine protein kinase